MSYKKEKLISIEEDEKNDQIPVDQ